MPSFDSGDDFVGVFGPNKGPWIGVCFSDEVVDRTFEFLDRAEGATLEAPLGQEGEHAFNCVEPRGRSRSEVENETRVARKPFQDLGMLVRGVVVDNDMDSR